MVIVSDTSAINALLQVGKIEILRALYGKVLIPVAVEKELLRSHASIPVFIQTASFVDDPELQELCKNLDEGEKQAIMLAVKVKADLLLIDEKKGRVVAAQAGLRFTGLVGALIEAKHRGVIANLGDLLDSIITEAGFRLSASIRTAVLHAVGE